MWDSVAGLDNLSLGSCVLLFFALYTPGSPPSSGAHWSVKQSKLQSSHSLTASSRPKQAGRQAGEVTAEVFQVKDHPRKPCLRPLDSHCGGVRDFVLRSLSLKKLPVIRCDLFMIFVSVLWVRRGEKALLNPKINFLYMKV